MSNNGNGWGSVLSGTRTKDEAIKELKALFERYDQATDPHEMKVLLAQLWDVSREVSRG